MGAAPAGQPGEAWGYRQLPLDGRRCRGRRAGAPSSAASGGQARPDPQLASCATPTRRAGRSPRRRSTPPASPTAARSRTGCRAASPRAAAGSWSAATRGARRASSSWCSAAIQAGGTGRSPAAGSRRSLRPARPSPATAGPGRRRGGRRRTAPRRASSFGAVGRHRARTAILHWRRPGVDARADRAPARLGTVSPRRWRSPPAPTAHAWALVRDRPGARTRRRAAPARHRSAAAALGGASARRLRCSRTATPRRRASTGVRPLGGAAAAAHRDARRGLDRRHACEAGGAPPTSRSSTTPATAA